MTPREERLFRIVFVVGCVIELLAVVVASAWFGWAGVLVVTLLILATGLRDALTLLELRAMRRRWRPTTIQVIGRTDQEFTRRLRDELAKLKRRDGGLGR